jgi:CubicO group peptidase (beta-lactamase class C family)
MKYYVFVALMLQLCSVAQTQSFDDKAHQTLKNFIGQFPQGTQFSVGILDGEDTHFYGQVKLKDSIQKIDNSASVFQIGSVTKVFTASLLAQLVLEKQLKLTDTLQTFFDIPLRADAITLEQLATHTSGLPRLPSNLNLAAVDATNPYSSYAKEDLEYYLTTEMYTTEAEPSYQYSNLGFAILAKALENASGKSYSELLLEKLFQGLEMSQSSLDKDKVTEQLVNGLNAEGKPTPVWDMGPFEGAGAMLSSALDISKFLRAHFKDEDNAFALTTLPAFLVNPNLRLGLGWHILQDEEGQDLYWHNGGTGGYSASIFMMPEAQKAVILLTNVSAFHSQSPKIDELGFRLLEEF